MEIAFLLLVTIFGYLENRKFDEETREMEETRERQKIIDGEA